MKERMDERREQRHKQTNSGSMSVQSRTGVGSWGVCSFWMRYRYLMVADDGTANGSPNGSNVAGSHKSPERAIKST